MWEAVCLLEADSAKVLCITADGASPNRKFFKMHKTPELSVLYKTNNPYVKDGCSTYFVSDPPHLIKTVGPIQELLALDTCRYVYQVFVLRLY